MEGFLLVFNYEPMVQVTFSLKETKITRQTHIRKFEILEISIPWCNFPFRFVWYTFLNRKNSEYL